jgi:hypothetical protein
MAFLTLLALSAAAPSAPAPSSGRAQLLAEFAASDIAIVDYAGMVANELTLEKFCRGQNKGLALKLARMIADAPAERAEGPMGFSQPSIAAPTA